MMAGYFVFSGVKALKDPEPYVAEHERFASTVVPLAKKVAPAEVATNIPEDTATLVRISGGMRVLGGLGLITGKGRRLGAGMLAASMVPQLMATNPLGGADPIERSARRNEFLKDLALVGGALIATGDTEGKPSLAWRAQDQSKRLSKKVDRQRQSIASSVDSARQDIAGNVEQFRKDVEKAQSKAPKQSRRARKRAEKRANELHRAAHRRAAEIRKQAAKEGKRRRKELASS